MSQNKMITFPSLDTDQTISTNKNHPKESFLGQNQSRPHTYLDIKMQVALNTIQFNSEKVHYSFLFICLKLKNFSLLQGHTREYLEQSVFKNPQFVALFYHFLQRMAFQKEIKPSLKYISKSAQQKMEDFTIDFINQQITLSELNNICKQQEYKIEQMIKQRLDQINFILNN